MRAVKAQTSIRSLVRAFAADTQILDVDEGPGKIVGLLAFKEQSNVYVAINKIS